MQASAPALICGKKPPRAINFVVLIVVFFLSAGCEKKDEVPDHVPVKHAEVRATYLGEIVTLNAQSMVLLHPSSDRQRHAREQLLYLEGLKDRQD